MLVSNLVLQSKQPCLVEDCGAALSQAFSTGRNLVSASVETVLWKKINVSKGVCENKVSSELDGLYHEGVSSSKSKWLGKADCVQNMKSSQSRSAYVFFISTIQKLFSFARFLEFCFVLFCFVLCVLQLFCQHIALDL